MKGKQFMQKYHLHLSESELKDIARDILYSAEMQKTIAAKHGLRPRTLSNLKATKRFKKALEIVKNEV